MTKRRAAKRDPNDVRDLRVALYCRVSQDRDGTEKSVNEQEQEGRRWVTEHLALLADVYRDADLSASRFTTKQRPDFERLLRDIRSGKLDVVWFWELSRSSRRLGVFAELRDLCRDQGVLWVIRDRVYDPNDYAGMMTLGMLSVIGENESELTSLRVLRSKTASAVAGKPAGRVTYGYKRIYDPATGKPTARVPNIYDDGLAVADSPAAVVREIFDRVVAGDSIMAILRDLNDRGIPGPTGKPWSHTTILGVAKRRAYIGQRIHQGEIMEGITATWPPLIEPEVFWAAQQVLSDPNRVTYRPGRARHLLSNQIRCAVCGGRMRIASTRRPLRTGGHSARYLTYQCVYKSCTGIRVEDLDAYVQEVIVKWLSDPDVCAELTRGRDSAEAGRARADAAQLRADLAEWRQLAKAGKVTALTFAGVESDRLARIAEAEQREQASALPPVLVGNIGPQAEAGWERLDLAVKRQIITAVADIRIKPVGRGRKVHPAARIKGRWLLGDGGDWPPFAPDSDGAS